MLPGFLRISSSPGTLPGSRWAGLVPVAGEGAGGGGSRPPAPASGQPRASCCKFIITYEEARAEAASRAGTPAVKSLLKQDMPETTGLVSTFWLQGYLCLSRLSSAGARPWLHLKHHKYEQRSDQVLGPCRCLCLPKKIGLLKHLHVVSGG